LISFHIFIVFQISPPMRGFTQGKHAKLTERGAEAQFTPDQWFHLEERTNQKKNLRGVAMTKGMVLITGGAGFIGSHLTDELLRAGYSVRILDNLTPQVHGENAQRPSYLAADAELQVGDVRDSDAVARALEGIDAVVHLAAAVGVGQSMYEIEAYTSVNNLGTAVLLEQLAKRPVGRLVVASSMSLYGEGRYRSRSGKFVDTAERTLDQLRRHEWELNNEEGELEPIPTPEEKTPSLTSILCAFEIRSGTTLPDDRAFVWNADGGAAVF
jgi:hypothetical protein